MNAGLARVRDVLARASRITVLTGAGVSAASGIPTFRGPDGLWRKFRAETLATPEAFEQDPRLVWEWYDWRRCLIAAAAPNAAHTVLARWLRARPGVTLVTQNVDGLHERAGTDRLIRLHGSIWHVRCWSECPDGRREWLEPAVPLPCLPPRCPHCGGLARPAVVWFGEVLDSEALSAAAAAAACDVFFSVGTSAVVYPAAGLLHHARRHGAFTVEINAAVSSATDIVDVALQGKAEDILAELDSAV